MHAIRATQRTNRTSTSCATASCASKRHARAQRVARPSQRRVTVALSTPARVSTRCAAVDVAQVAIAGIDTSGFDQMFINGLKVGIPLYGAVVGAVFIFGTIAKVAFPEKYDAALYGAEAKKEVEKSDLDNLSEEDAKAGAELEAELRKEGKL